MSGFGTGRRPYRWGVLLLIAAFIVVPIVEIYVLIQVGQVIGAWWTILLLIADSVFGSWLIKREGGKAWSALRIAIAAGKMPARELADGALVLIGGTLMISPGFVTDGFGILMILPFTRPLARRLLTAVITRRIVAIAAAPPGPPFQTPRPGPGSTSGPVVKGDVVD